MSDKIELTDLSKEELIARLQEAGEPAFRAKQIWQWVYFYGKTDFADQQLPIVKRCGKNWRIISPSAARRRLPSSSQATKPANGCWHLPTAKR